MPKPKHRESKMPKRVLLELGISREQLRNRGQKTPLMLLLEHTYTQPIETIIGSGSLSDIAKRTGVDNTTISRWRKKLGIQQRNGTNLPS